MKTIELTQGYAAQVDDEDYERVNAFKWYANVQRRKDGSIWNVRAARSIWTVGIGNTGNILMHRFILGVIDPTVEVDHAPDHSQLNNQRCNIRLATKAENCHNQQLLRENKSGFKGVHWDEVNQRWLVGIIVNNVRTFLGRFPEDQLIEAARAYDAAAIKYFGRFALTNVMLGLLPPAEAGVDYSKRSPLAINNTCGFKGVTWAEANHKWKAQIRVDGKNIYLGYFPEDRIVDAALTYDVAAIKYFGENAVTNTSLGLLPSKENDNGFHQGPKGPTESSLAA